MLLKLELSPFLNEFQCFFYVIYFALIDEDNHKLTLDFDKGCICDMKWVILYILKKKKYLSCASQCQVFALTPS